MKAAMKIQLVCVMLLAFSSWSLCSDSEEEMKALEADLLTNMHTSKEKQNGFPKLKMKAHDYPRSKCGRQERAKDENSSIEL